MQKWTLKNGGKENEKVFNHFSGIDNSVLLLLC